MKIGVCLESLGMSFRQGLPRISRMGLSGVQVNALGELAPDQLTATGQREVRNLLKTYDLQLTALNCPLRRGIDIAQDQQPRLDFIRKVMDLSFELGPRVVIVQCPRVPENAEAATFPLLDEALRDLGAYGDKIGVRIGLEIGFDSADKVKGLLDRYDFGSLAVNFDPANLLLHGHNPAQNIIPLQGRLVQVHARDVRISTVSSGASEVRLGAGDVEWLSIVGALTAIEYRGFITIEREQGAGIEEVEAGIAFLKKFVM